jgi:hypothetical protein
VPFTTHEVSGKRRGQLNFFRYTFLADTFGVLYSERSTRRVPTTGETTIPQFFFNLCTPDGVDRDEEGVELPDIETAYLEAFHTAIEMWIEAVRHRRDPSQHWFEIADAAGQALLTLPFTEVIQKRMGTRTQAPPEEPRDRDPAQQTRARRAAVQVHPRFEEMVQRAVHSRNLGATVVDQIRVAREQLNESRALLAQLGSRGR